MIAVYARQSLDKKDSLSIETQIELCKAEEEKDAPCKVYIDRGYSGKNLEKWGKYAQNNPNLTKKRKK